jgi:endonuclease/exonuclease/phosphatase family metal-dependent hydrolase
MYILAALLACTSKKLPDTAPPSGPEDGVFTVLTYNVHGLPGIVTGDSTSGRIEQIAPMLNAFGFVGLQEDFVDDNHDVLDAASQHQTKLRFDDRLEGEGRYYGSGLAIFAQAALVDHHHEHFSDCHGTLDSSSDCLASKGFQIIRLELGPDATVDILNTHMEAGGGAEDNEARGSNLQQIVEGLETWSSGQALIVMGDTNLHPGDPAEQPLIDALVSEVGLEDTCTATGCTETDHIDRIFYRSGGNVELSATGWTREESFVDDEGEDLSDHPAISARFSWTLR